MQNSIWKLTALAGVVGIGCLGVLLVQQTLHEEVSLNMDAGGRGITAPKSEGSDDSPVGLPEQNAEPAQPNSSSSTGSSTNPFESLTNVAQQDVDNKRGIDFTGGNSSTADDQSQQHVIGFKPQPPTGNPTPELLPSFETTKSAEQPGNILLTGGEKPIALDAPNGFESSNPTSGEAKSSDTNPFELGALPELGKPASSLEKLDVPTADRASENPFGTAAENSLPPISFDGAAANAVDAATTKPARLDDAIDLLPTTPTPEAASTPAATDAKPALELFDDDFTTSEEKKSTEAASTTPSETNALPLVPEPLTFDAPPESLKTAENPLPLVDDAKTIKPEPSAGFRELPMTFPPLEPGVSEKPIQLDNPTTNPFAIEGTPAAASGDAGATAADAKPTSPEPDRISDPKSTVEFPDFGSELSENPKELPSSEPLDIPSTRTFGDEKPAGSAIAGDVNEPKTNPDDDQVLRGNATIDHNVLQTLKPQLKIEKRAPKTATLGKPFVYDIIVSNTGTSPANKVVVEDGIPKGSKLDATKPQAELVDGRLVWKIGTIKPGDQKTISVRIIPTAEGTVGSIATVYTVAEVAAVTTITAPKLKLTFNATKQVELGGNVILDFRVENTGSALAKDVFIRTKLPAGLTHPSGDDLEYKVGELAAGDSKEVKLTLQAVELGEIVNIAEATAADDISVEAKVTINVTGSRLVVKRSGPERRFVGYPAEFKNEVSNRSTQTVVNATLVEKLPLGMDFVEASEGGQYNAVQRTVAWSIEKIDPAEKKAFTVKLVPRAKGTKTSIVQVVEPKGVEARAVSNTRVEDFASLALDISEVLRPVAVGDRVAMRVRARNRGTAAASNVAVSVTIPKSMRLVTAGPAKYTVKDDVVTFSPTKSLAKSASQDFDLVLEAITKSDARLKAQVAADEMASPLSREEAIMIFTP